ncbi:MAG: hypothetical protein P1V20_27275 [Verrucomicrobiales bacterium]|nr:hypothetical protein [Verrucomicrobiales bacterium]
MKTWPIITSLCLLTGILCAEIREWTSSADPTRKITGEFVNLEGETVSLKLSTGQLVKFELSKLSKADQEIARNGGKEPEPEEEPKGPESTPAEIMEMFVFGEDPDEVYVRLKKSTGLRGGVNEILRGRTGLNGMYFIKPGGIRYSIFFDYGEDGDGLAEVSLQSASFTGEQYHTDLNASWLTVRGALLAKYGKPVIAGSFPDKAALTAGLSLSSDLWQTDKGQLYLGVGNVDGAYSCVIKLRESGFFAPQ